MRARQIQLFQPDFGAAEQCAVQRTLESGWTGRGVLTSQFETAFAAHVGVDPESIFMLPSATDGLFHMASLLDIHKGDEVIIPSISFIGAAQAVASVGASVRLADVDARTLNPSVHHLEAARTTRTKAVILIHYGGTPCDMVSIGTWADQNGIIVVEDSACSPTSSFDGRACGTFGDFAVWSFDSMKMLSTIEGGAIYVRDPSLMAKLRRECCLGMSTSAGHASQATTRWWEFDVSSLGRRSQFNDVSASIGLVQLARLSAMLDRRRQIVERYNLRFQEAASIMLPLEPSKRMRDSHYLYWIQIDQAHRDALATRLRDIGIYTSFRYFPLHRTTLFASGADLRGANDAADTTLNLPCHSLLSDADIERVADSVLEFMQHA